VARHRHPRPAIPDQDRGSSHEEAVMQDPALNRERFMLAEIVSQPDLVKE
jgi:hypothetical protein